jgi:glycosyltransferase involved in cell wall biosynthesis
MVREFQNQIANYDAAIIEWDAHLFGETEREHSRNLVTIAESLGGRPAIAILHETQPPREWLPPLPRRPLVQPWSRAFLPTWRQHLDRRDMMNNHRAVVNAMNANMMLLVHGQQQRQAWIRQGVSPDKIQSILFPMEPGTSLAEPRHLDETTTVNLLMFGFVAEYKGYEIALNAMRVLPENYVLIIAGDRAPGNWDRTFDAIHCFIQTGIWPHRGPYPAIATIERRYTKAERQSIESRVKFIGHVPPEQVADVMRRADIALAPYRRSNGSAALADYVEYARPSIASALPAFRDFAEDENCVRFVATDAPFELAHAVRRLAMDLQERRRMFNAARTFAQTNSFAALARHCVSIFGASSPAQRARAASHPGSWIMLRGDRRRMAMEPKASSALSRGVADDALGSSATGGPSIQVKLI